MKKKIYSLAFLISIYSFFLPLPAGARIQRIESKDFLIMTSYSLLAPDKITKQQLGLYLTHLKLLQGDISSYGLIICDFSQEANFTKVHYPTLEVLKGMDLINSSDLITANEVTGQSVSYILNAPFIHALQEARKITIIVPGENRKIFKLSEELLEEWKEVVNA